MTYKRTPQKFFRISPTTAEILKRTAPSEVTNEQIKEAQTTGFLRKFWLTVLILAALIAICVAINYGG
jgi:hypothetical protein